MYIVIILDDDDSDSDNNNDNYIDAVLDKNVLEWFCLENQAKKCHVVSGLTKSLTKTNRPKIHTI